MSDTPEARDEQDRILVTRYLDGETGVAGDLVDRYQRPLFNLALRMLGNVQDAEDVTQTVFLNAFVAMGSYDPKYRFYSWLYRMAINESLNQLKRRKRTVTLDDGAQFPARDAGAEGSVENDDRVRTALMNLRPDDRTVVVLRHFLSLSYERISETLEVPVRTVKSRLFTARERLRLVMLAQKV